jgi:adenine phosphoribosyltransferase
MALANYIRDIQGFRKKEFYLKTLLPLLIDPKATKECLKSWFHR